MTAILVVSSQTEVERLLPWGWLFAHSADLPLMVVVAQENSGKRVWKDLRLDDEPTTLLDAFRAVGTAPSSDDEAASNKSPDHSEITSKQLRDPNIDRAILELLPKQQARMLIVHMDELGRDLDRSWQGRLYRKANCESILLRVPNAATSEGGRILVPTNGDTNANAALRRASQIATVNERPVTALLVSPGGDILSLEAAEKNVDNIVTRVLGKRSSSVDRCVHLADEFSVGIQDVLEAASHGKAVGAPACDESIELVLIGAYRNRTIRKVMQSAGSGESLVGADAPAFAAVKAGVALGPRSRQAIERVVQQWVPQIDREGRKELFANIQSSSEWNFDFIALICLSTLIAALGLARNQAPVVIGAMLVAPLMTPLVGAGLALVQGNSSLIWKALQSVVYGFFLAFVIGWIVGTLGNWFPMLEMDSLSDEILGRTSPGLVDLAVALVGGMAAAYAISRRLSSALPGVAIAAALVPPIASTGITFSRGEWGFAQGALLLFLTNIVAIIIGTAISLWLVGVRDKHEHGNSQAWTLRFAAALLLCTVGLAFLISHQAPITGQAAIDTLSEKIRTEVADRGAELVSVDLSGQDEIRVVIESPVPDIDVLPSRLRTVANDHFGNDDSRIKLEIRHVVKSGPPRVQP